MGKCVKELFILYHKVIIFTYIRIMDTMKLKINLIDKE
jgi:hypothetical protein